MSNVLSANGTMISCDYSTLGTSTGGYAYIGNIDSSGREVMTFGNELGGLAQPEYCQFNPDGAGCVDDFTYAVTADTIGHEIMHTHGYAHVSDRLWNLNDVNVGDRTADGTYTYTLDDFCGYAPAYTPNGGIAPSAPTSTPTPGAHPTYGTGIPYEAGQCLFTVLAWSSQSGHMHEDCGASFPGFKIVDTVMSGDPSTVTTSCVRDPYVGTAYASNVPGAPIPPRAPTCTFVPSCRVGGDETLSCSDHNANFVHLERRVMGGTRWERTTHWSAGYEYRACAESLYGRACSTPTQGQSLCAAQLPKFRPIPWWEWEPFTGIPALNGQVSSRTFRDAMHLVPVPASLAGAYPQLGAASGDLSPAFAALGVGLYDPSLGIFTAEGPSTGALPPVRGTAFASAIGADGNVHFFGIGGDGVNGAPSTMIYDGALTIDDVNGNISASWKSAYAPFARTHASAVGNVAGDTVHVFGGRSSKGVSGDLWSFGAATGKWTFVSAQVATPRVDAAMTTSGTSLVLFGGADANGTLLSDLVIVDPMSGKTQTFATGALPRANAAIVVDQGNVYVYGGHTAKAATDTLDVISLASGKLLSTRSIGIAASSGSALSIDEDGVLTIVPGAVPNANASGGAFVGPIDQLKLISQ
jgi:hypothetical protein